MMANASTDEQADTMVKGVHPDLKHAPYGLYGLNILTSVSLVGQRLADQQDTVLHQ